MEAKSEVYVASTEHSNEDIEKVIKLADEERSRRVADSEGETRRRNNALQVSELFASSLRQTWFQKGSSFVLDLLNGVKNSSQVRTLNAKIQVLAHNGIAAANDLTYTISNTANDVGLKSQEFTKSTIEKGVETAQQLAQGAKETVAVKAQEVSVKANETAQEVKVKGIETAQDIKGRSLERANSFKAKSLETAQDAKEKVQGFAQKVKDAVSSLSLYKKLNKSFSNLAETTNLAFTHLEEENERARRMNSSEEIYAITNALNVARLIKELSPALYRPLSEPESFYHTRLLEEIERSRRVFESKSDKAAITNARSVSLLITSKFSAPVVVPIAPAKVEIVEEIKVHKPIPATM